jgi:hypothetical protein
MRANKRAAGVRQRPSSFALSIVTALRVPPVPRLTLWKGYSRRQRLRGRAIEVTRLMSTPAGTT